MAKTDLYTANTEIDYEGKKLNKTSEPFKLDETTAEALTALGHVTKVSVPDPAKKTAEPKE